MSSWWSGRWQQSQLLVLCITVFDDVFTVSFPYPFLSLALDEQGLDSFWIALPLALATAGAVMSYVVILVPCTLPFDCIRLYGLSDVMTLRNKWRRITFA